MRLSAEQIAVIVNTVQRIISPLTCEIYLYGSRVHDGLKGGDIDLLLVGFESAVASIHEKKYEILVEIKKSPLIGNRKLDLVIATHDEMKTEPFLKLISDEKIRLDD